MWMLTVISHSTLNSLLQVTSDVRISCLVYFPVAFNNWHNNKWYFVIRGNFIILGSRKKFMPLIFTKALTSINKLNIINAVYTSQPLLLLLSFLTMFHFLFYFRRSNIKDKSIHRREKLTQAKLYAQFRENLTEVKTTLFQYKGIFM